MHFRPNYTLSPTMSSTTNRKHLALKQENEYIYIRSNAQAIFSDFHFITYTL